MARKLVVLGATGTVGRNTLDVARRHPDRLHILALTAHRDVEGLAALCREFQPCYAVLGDTRSAPPADTGRTEWLRGPQALADVAALAEAEVVMSAIAGAVGLLPTLAAVRAGKQILIANKEPLVMAGGLLMTEARKAGAVIIPIDSEHNAIFQCLPAGYRCGEAPKGVARLVLTASGGPFLHTPQEQLAAVTPEQAVRHPNWVMGRKISVDSASMMNKGLELIEAAVLYQLGPAQLSVVVHPQSVIHSLVEYVDGSMLAQLGAPDMRVPIAHALAYPERFRSGVSGLDLAQLGRFDFAAPDEQRFPCLRLARQALAEQGGAPNVLNASNEVAVEAFLNRQIRYTQIPAVIEQTLSAAAPGAPTDLDGILGLDAWARARAREQLHA